jgi:hypothetical protein
LDPNGAACKVQSRQRSPEVVFVQDLVGFDAKLGERSSRAFSNGELPRSTERGKKRIAVAQLVGHLDHHVDTLSGCENDVVKGPSGELLNPLIDGHCPRVNDLFAKWLDLCPKGADGLNEGLGVRSYGYCNLERR